ncbi:hypothetical protein E2C01_040532 [Portunus trituberculatus]|uniref:Uncharacterized protein n=1 Tax=Portunus trituberculatus TaxID=210409 RepID=A0A5B7FR15_PORTR|nr:hypothetical protein [Portunus trituberculatus]
MAVQVTLSSRHKPSSAVSTPATMPPEHRWLTTAARNAVYLRPANFGALNSPLHCEFALSVPRISTAGGGGAQDETMTRCVTDQLD